MDHEGPEDPTQVEEADGPLEFDRIRPLEFDRIRPLAGVRPRLGVSVPGAIGGVLLIGALAFGANLGVPRFVSDGGTDGRDPDVAVIETEPTDAPDDEPADKPDQSEPENEPDQNESEDEPDPTQATEPEDESDTDEPTDKPDAEATEKPESEPDATAKPTEKPEPKATPKPTERPEPKPTPKPTAKPAPTPTAKPVLSLSLAVKEGAIFLDWGACEVDGADVYKVVRSTDSTVKWPMGEGDDLIAAVEVGGSTKGWDEHATPGKKAWYRVFCLRHTEDGYKVLAATGTKAIVAPDEPEPTPKPTPLPEPSAMWIEAGIEGGNVVVSWEACEGESFSHYRILRKAGDDAQVIAEIENASTTTYVDDGLEAGAYHYAVQCKGHVGDDWFLLGSTEWATVTVE